LPTTLSTENPDEPAAPATTPEAEPRPLMLGMGWFPGTLGGLDRYYRALFEQLPGARGVVIGPAPAPPPGLEVVAGHDSPFAVRLLGYWRAARRAAGETDLIDAHFALYAAAPLLLGAARGRPAVFHFHGPWAEENLAAHDSSRGRFLLRRALERRVLRRADAQVVLSSAFRRVLLERYGLTPWEIHVWPPGVSLEQFDPGDRDAARARLAIAPGAFVAACVRRLVPRMGIDVLLDAWQELGAELPDGSTLLIVGEGPLAPELAARAAQPPLEGRVRLLGRVGDEELADVYRAADVAVVPTLAVEGFGLVVLEAAACGTPSIVSDVGGLREAAAGLDRSLLLPPADARILGRRLRAAAAGELPGRAATRAYAEGFSWQRLGEQHRTLYRRLAAGGGERRLRIVYLDHVARLSGGEIAILRLLPHLQHVQAHVILAEDGLLAERLEQAGISVEVLPLSPATRELRRESLRLGVSGAGTALQTLGYSARLARRLRRLRPDLVHSNSLKSGVYGGIAARAAGVPLVWHLRDRIADDYLPRPTVRLMRGVISSLATGVIANSAATLQTLPPRARERGLVIPDSVELSTHPSPVAADTVTFGMLGRIAPWKGQDLFLRAFAEAFPGGSQRARIVGTPMFGEEPFEAELRAQAERLGLGGRVEFRGFREDIWSELAAFDVLVHASVIPEPFGQVVLEGMAAGVAVVAADEGGPADVVEDRRTGRLFRARDAESLAATMAELAGDPAQRERLGRSARGAVADYHPRALAARLELAYAGLLPRRAAAGAP
jgi:glycosyltransferase involved in cell wall biosynthesis